MNPQQVSDDESPVTTTIVRKLLRTVVQHRDDPCTQHEFQCSPNGDIGEVGQASRNHLISIVGDDHDTKCGCWANYIVEDQPYFAQMVAEIPFTKDKFVRVEWNTRRETERWIIKDILQAK